MKAHRQTNNEIAAHSPSTLIPIQAAGFNAYADAFALAEQWLVFISLAGHKDAVKAIKAMLLTNHWVNVGVHDICLLPGRKYGTIVRTLPSGITHTAIFMEGDAQSKVHYALTANPGIPDADLYFRTVITHSAVPVHSSWKTWLYKRALKKKEIEPLTVQGIDGIKVSLDDESLAEDISVALKKGKLKTVFSTVSPLPFPKTSSRI
jgi:hypothetical protein